MITRLNNAASMSSLKVGLGEITDDTEDGFQISGIIKVGFDNSAEVLPIEFSSTEQILKIKNGDKKVSLGLELLNKACQK